ncbi:MAG: ABC transporter permease [Treponema sp.]|nr:ABC transporter permease [Treponema sp.]
MKYVKLFQLALKYLWRYKRRYLFLFLALSFGFTIVTLITSFKDDMYENVYKSAQDHYAGDIVVAGFDKDSVNHFHLSRHEIEAVYASLENIGINPIHAVERTHFGDNGILYYNGTAVRLKYVIGVDWDNEASYFNSLDYRSPLDVSAADEDSIVLSHPVAELLGARQGDSLILEIDTRHGQKNTGVFIVKGIVYDSSIFGYYKVYVSRLTLNRLLLHDDNDAYMVGIYLANRQGAERKRLLLHNELSRHILVGPLVKDRDELAKEMNRGSWKGIMAFVINLPVYLSEIADLLGAINIITYFLYGMMLLIILVSAAVTYRLLLHERAREMGTMQAIGFHEEDLRLVLIIETFALACVSIAAGFTLTFLLSSLVSLIPFSWFPGFEIFLKNGKLRSLYLPGTVLVNITAILGMMLIAVSVPAYRSLRSPLPRLLAGGDA